MLWSDHQTIKKIPLMPIREVSISPNPYCIALKSPQTRLDLWTSAFSRGLSSKKISKEYFLRIQDIKKLRLAKTEQAWILLWSWISFHLLYAAHLNTLVTSSSLQWSLYVKYVTVIITTYIPNLYIDTQYHHHHHHHHDHPHHEYNDHHHYHIWGCHHHDDHLVFIRGRIFPFLAASKLCAVTRAVLIATSSSPSPYEYIRIFIHINFLDTNISGYAFVARLWYEYICIFVCINFQIPTMFLFDFYGYYTLLMDILLITMIKKAI